MSARGGLVFALWMAISRTLLSVELDTCPGDLRREVNRLNHFSEPDAVPHDEVPDRWVNELSGKEVLPAGPASAKKHMRQCRAVLGPPPEIDCSKGQLIEAKSTNSIDCDPISEDMGDHPCPRFTRLGTTKVGPVSWMFICHSFDKEPPPEKRRAYSTIGVIGYNPNTGESCFAITNPLSRWTGGATSTFHPVTPGKNHFDPKEEGKWVEWEAPTTHEPPRRGGDHRQRAGSEACIHCHDNNDPIVVTRFTNQSRVGGDGKMDILPENPNRSTPGSGYRVIGTDHNKLWADIKPMAVQPKNPDGTPDRTCTRCHTITDQKTGEQFIHSSVGKSVKIRGDDKIHQTAYMPPSNPGSPRAIEAVNRLEYCIRYPNDRKKCFPPVSVLTACPTPDSPARENNMIWKSPSKNQMEVSWAYSDRHNKRSGVPNRDDIRFEVELSADDGTKCIFNNIAPPNRENWNFKFPTREGAKYKIKLAAKRFCFQNGDLTSAWVDYSSQSSVEGKKLKNHSN